MILDEDIKDGLSLDVIRCRLENKFGINIAHNGVSKLRSIG